MATSDFLNSSLQQFLPTNLKQEVLGRLWELEKLPEGLTEASGWGDGYFVYYKEQCVATASGKQELPGISTHENVFATVHFLRDPGATRQSIKDKLIRKYPDLASSDYDDWIFKSVNFAVRLWLMLDVGDYMSGVLPGQTRLCWGEESIRNLINSEFNINPVLDSNIKLEKMFNACNLERLAGIKICWTNNLADHLRMMDDDRRVAIFHHAFFLQCHKTWYA
jgi:hypothetical protein